MSISTLNERNMNKNQSECKPTKSFFDFVKIYTQFRRKITIINCYYLSSQAK